MPARQVISQATGAGISPAAPLHRAKACPGGAFNEARVARSQLNSRGSGPYPIDPWRLKLDLVRIHHREQGDTKLQDFFVSPC